MIRDGADLRRRGSNSCVRRKGASKLVASVASLPSAVVVRRFEKHAGVVHQHMNPGLLLQQLVREAPDVGQQAEIRDRDRHVVVARPGDDFASGGLRLRLVATQQDHARTEPGHLVRGSRPRPTWRP